MNNTEYQNNTEPAIGDRVKFKSDLTGPVYIVTSVNGGRLGNKIGVSLERNQSAKTTFTREYYYYCFVKA